MGSGKKKSLKEKRNNNNFILNVRPCDKHLTSVVVLTSHNDWEVGILIPLPLMRLKGVK